MLEALRQIETRQPPARRREPPEPEFEPQPLVAEATVATPQPAAAPADIEWPEVLDSISEAALPAEVESSFGTAPLEEEQSPEDVEPREIEPLEMTVPSEEFVPTPEPPDRAGEPAADPRYVALAETILGGLPAEGRGAVLLAGLDDRDVGGALRPLFPLLAERIPGRTIVVDCNDGCRAFARGDGGDGGDADAGPASPGSDETFWARAIFRTCHPRLDLLLGVDTTTEDASATYFEPEALLRELRRAYQLVVLVGEPSSDLEIASLARVCDGTYLVVRLGQTSRRRARRAIRMFEQAGVGVLGCVLLER
jgi:hypothetical protein